MGCSRPGAIAVICSLIAGLLSLFSLLLPYWSEITVVGSAGSGSDEDITSSLEVAFGIWGTCVMIQNRTVGDTLSSFLMESASSHPDNFSVAAEATFTCASFFTEGVVGIHCEATHSFSDGRCTRSERTTPSSLCAADKPVDMLLLAWDEDQKRGTVRISSDERQKVTEWLNHFLPDMCGALGHATVVLSAISTAGSGMVILLLLFGVIFDTLESRVVHGGAITTLIAASVQAALIGVWIFETLILHHEGNHFGTAFYAAIASIVVHAITFVVAMRHLRIEKDALVELGLLEDDDESIDDIFKTKKLADDWDDGDTVVTASSPRMSPRISPRKEDSSRQVEVVV